FGVLFNNLGHSWEYAALMGLLVFAGAAQFMAIGLLASKATLIEVFVSTLVLNARHIFYGISLIEAYIHPLLQRLYLIFGLTDETFSIVTSAAPRPAPASPYYFWVTAFNHGYWVLGCTLGALAGKQFDLSIPGLEFALVALFVVLALEQFKRLPFKGLVATAL